MSAPSEAARHAVLMDRVYRYQRHFYDLTRKYYLLGRDRLIAGLDAGDGSVLEIGCGTGRNLVLAARRFPAAGLFGLDISSAMLEKAEAAIGREGLAGRITLARADACDFDAGTLFARNGFDRVFLSYSLSMIPDWEAALDAALAAVAPGGSLHLVDFGRQERLPAWFRTGLRRWLKGFHVEPRDSMREALESKCRQTGATLRFDSLFGGYAVLAVVSKARRA